MTSSCPAAFRSYRRARGSSLVLDSLRSSLAFPLALRTHSLPLNADSTSFCAVVFDQLAEPRVLQCFPGSDSLFWVVDENLPKQVEEQLVKLCGWRDNLVQTLHGADEFPRLPGSVGERIGEMLIFEEAGGAVTIAALALLHHFANERLVDLVTGDGLTMLVSQCSFLVHQSRYKPPSWQDAPHSHESGTEHLQSSTRLRCSQVTTDQWGGSSLYRSQCKLVV